MSPSRRRCGGRKGKCFASDTLTAGRKRHGRLHPPGRSRVARARPTRRLDRPFSSLAGALQEDRSPANDVHGPGITPAIDRIETHCHYQRRPTSAEGLASQAAAAPLPRPDHDHAVPPDCERTVGRVTTKRTPSITRSSWHGSRVLSKPARVFGQGQNFFLRSKSRAPSHNNTTQRQPRDRRGCSLV